MAAHVHSYQLGGGGVADQVAAAIRPAASRTTANTHRAVSGGTRSTHGIAVTATILTRCWHKLHTIVSM